MKTAVVVNRKRKAVDLVDNPPLRMSSFILSFTL